MNQLRVCGFHFAVVEARDAGKPAAADRSRSRGACCFRATHFARGHFNGGADDGRERAQIARAGRSLRPAGSLRARQPGCARWPGFADLPVELLEDARLDLARARDQIVLSGDRGPAEREEQREERYRGSGRWATVHTESSCLDGQGTQSMANQP